MSGNETTPTTGLATVEEAMTFLSLGRTKLYDLIANGAIRSITIGKSRRIPWAELHDFCQRPEQIGG